VDRNNNVLAIDRPVYSLYAHPKLFEASQRSDRSPTSCNSQSVCGIGKTVQHPTAALDCPALSEDIAAQIKSKSQTTDQWLRAD